MSDDQRIPFVTPEILELWPRAPAARCEYLRVARQWSAEHKIRISLAMSSLLGEGMKCEIAREHPDWPPRKVSLEVGRLNWGWEIAPPLYGPLEDEARERGESPSRRAEFLANWRLEPPDEPIVRTGQERRSPEEAERALDRFLSAGPCG